MATSSQVTVVVKLARGEILYAVQPSPAGAIVYVLAL